MMLDHSFEPCLNREHATDHCGRMVQVLGGECGRWRHEHPPFPMKDRDKEWSEFEKAWRAAGQSLAEHGHPTLAAWPPVLPPGTLVWCEDCALEGSALSERRRLARQPAALAPNGVGSLDLLCSKCKLVIATLFKGPA